MHHKRKIFPSIFKYILIRTNKKKERRIILVYNPPIFKLFQIRIINDESIIIIIDGIFLGVLLQKDVWQHALLKAEPPWNANEQRLLPHDRRILAAKTPFY